MHHTPCVRPSRCAHITLLGWSTLMSPLVSSAHTGADPTATPSVRITARTAEWNVRPPSTGSLPAIDADHHPLLAQSNDRRAVAAAHPAAQVVPPPCPATLETRMALRRQDEYMPVHRRRTELRPEACDLTSIKPDLRLGRPASANPGPSSHSAAEAAMDRRPVCRCTDDAPGEARRHRG